MSNRSDARSRMEPNTNELQPKLTDEQWSPITVLSLCRLIDGREQTIENQRSSLRVHAN